MPIINKKNELNNCMQLYPELQSTEELEDLIYRVSFTTIDELYKKSENENKFSFKFHNLNTENVIDIGISSDLPFGSFCKSIIIDPLNRFFKDLKKIKIINNYTYFTKNVADQLISRIWELSYKTLIHELKILKSENLLIGETEETRFAYYHDFLLEDKEYIEYILSENKELSNILSLIINRSLKNTLTILHRTEDEWNKLLTQFCINKNAKVTLIDVGMGDTHQNGQTVCTLHFSDQSRIMYKPRNLEVDQAFQEFLKFLNTKKVGKFNTVNFFSSGSDGWMEFISPKECTEGKQINEFYKKTGQYLAILYILNANDIHYENIIAHGENPMLIDLESLFVPKPNHYFEEFDSSFQKAQEFLHTSVNSIALLPTEITRSVDGTDLYADLGGVSFHKKQISPYKSVILNNKNLESMDFSLKNLELEPKHNNPVLNGITLEAYDYIQDIRNGFKNMYEWAIENREELVSKIQQLFIGKRIRFINKSTMFYSKLLDISTYPIFSKNSFYKKLLFHRVGLDGFKSGNPFLKHEYNDLLNMDVPYFSAITDKKKVYNSNGDDIGDILNETPLERCLTKIDNLSLTDLSKQLKLIEMSFLNKRKGHEDCTKISFVQGKSNHPKHTINYHSYLKTAKNIGDHLINEMITADENAYWIAPSLEGEQENIWSPGLVSLDLYSGNAGISIFLAQLYSCTGEVKYKDAAYKAIEPVRKFIIELEENSQLPFPLGVFSGTSGYFYAIYKTGIFLEDTKLENLFFDNIDKLKSFVIKDKTFDVIGGVTGTIHMLLNIAANCHVTKNKNHLIHLSIELEKHLRQHPVFKDQGKLYAGFSHGIAGVMSCYALLYKNTKNRIYKSNVLELRDKLNTFYSPVQKNWYNSNQNSDISNGWCHGAPGILLSFLICMECGIEIDEMYVKIAVNSTKDKALGNNITYCHGDLGTLSILERYANQLNDSVLSSQVELTFERLHQRYLKEIVSKNTIRHSYSFSLMIGITGAGLALINKLNKIRTNILWID
ncbi:type 2 lanthipeptide synthetase LanM family protein [Bacillus cereus]|nr:type 2 lanthipeptide synthetase LanM family protein [Bacillus cereus]